MLKLGLTLVLGLPLKLADKEGEKLEEKLALSVALALMLKLALAVMLKLALALMLKLAEAEAEREGSTMPCPATRLLDASRRSRGPADGGQEERQ